MRKFLERDFTYKPANSHAILLFLTVRPYVSLYVLILDKRQYYKVIIACELILHLFTVSSYVLTFKISFIIDHRLNRLFHEKTLVSTVFNK